MPKIFKYAAIGLAALIGLAVILVAFLAATFDPNDYKQTIIRLVQDKKQRTLSIPGEIKLTYFPKIGADLGEVSISEHKGSERFASIASAKVSLALIPLLSNQLIVDHVKIDGIDAQIRRYKDGTTNFDDLISKDEAGEEISFDIDSVAISNSRIAFDDMLEKRKIELANLNLSTGKIAAGVSSNISLDTDIKGSNPAIDGRLVLKSGFSFDLDSKHYVFKNTDADFQGKFADFSDLIVKLAGNAGIKQAEKRFSLDAVKLDMSGKHKGQALDIRLDAPKLAMTDAKVSGGKISGTAKLDQGTRKTDLNFSAPSFEGSPQAFKLPSLTLDATVKDAGLDAKATINGAIAGDIDKLLFSSPQLKLVLSGKQDGKAIDGSVSTPLKADLKASVIDMPAIVMALTLPNPGGGTFKLTADGTARADFGKQSLTAALAGKLDESAFDAKLGMSQFSPAAYSFDIGIDRLDVDRYQGKQAAGKSGNEGKPSAQAAGPGAEQPLDLSGLRDLRASGVLRIGALKFNNIKAANVRVNLRATAGKIDLNPLSASLYGGNAAGAVSTTASKAPSIALRQNLTGINVGPLLQDALGKAPLEGRGNVDLNVTTAGGGFTQWKKNLDGTMRVELRDGSIKGVNIAQTVRTAKARIGELRGKEAPQAGTGSDAEKTDFSEMTGSFRIVNGIARNDDLNIKSPLVRIGGAGDINLGQDRLDYLAKATVVSTLQGQGGPELQALKGLTIPVRLSGPFSAIGWRVDMEGLATELARQKIDEKKEELLEKAQKRLGGQEGKSGDGKIEDQIKERLLKGLFGK